MGIRDAYLSLYVLSIASVMVSMWYTWMIGIRTGGLRSAVKILLLCALNPVFYLLVFWVYSNIISLPFMMAVIYYGICLYQSDGCRREILYGVLESVAAALGFFIRPVVVIPVIALAICAVMYSIKYRKQIKRLLRCTVICAGAFVLCIQLISAINGTYFQFESDGSSPVTHWTMMGSHGEGRFSEEDVNYTGQFATKKEKREATLQKTIENYKKLGIKGFLDFEYKKLIISWAYGTSQISGRLARDMKMTKLYRYLIEGKSDWFDLYCFVFRMVTLLLIALGCASALRGSHINKYQFLYNLSFFGAILFYSFWEVKESYAVPFIPVMLLGAVPGASILEEKICCLTKRRCIKGTRILNAVSLLAMAGICFVLYRGMTEAKISMKDYSIRCNGEGSSTSVGETEDTLTQEFYLSKPINYIVLRAKPD